MRSFGARGEIGVWNRGGGRISGRGGVRGTEGRERREEALRFVGAWRVK